MSTPNPLIPQGTFQAQAAKSATNVRLAVATIVAIHVVFFGGLLLQGCKRDGQTAQNGAETNLTENAATNLALPPMESSAPLYYPSSNSLPTETGTAGTLPALHQDTGFAGNTAVQSNLQENLWQPTNITSPVGTTPETTETAAGPMKEYTIARGDSFSLIAKRNRTTVSALRQANPNVDPLKIRPGQKIKIPAPTATTVSAAAPATGGSSPSPTAFGSGTGQIYSVKAGDTLTKIARAHGVTVSQLRATNGLKTSRVNVGQKLRIPARAQASNVSTSTPATNPAF